MCELHVTDNHEKEQIQMANKDEAAKAKAEAEAAKAKAAAEKKAAEAKAEKEKAKAAEAKLKEEQKRQKEKEKADAKAAKDKEKADAKAAKDKERAEKKAQREKEKEERKNQPRKPREPKPWQDLEAGAKQKPPRAPSVAATLLETIKANKGATEAELQAAIDPTGEGKHKVRPLVNWMNRELGYGFVMNPKTGKISSLAPNLQVPEPKKTETKAA
jgi:hypothetical protein